MLTNVYVDGFNLYYGCVKGAPYKWLNLLALCERVLPKNHEINHIRYFTAIVRATSTDPQKPQRQHTYLRALRTIPNLTVHLGHFLTKEAEMRLINPLPDGTRKVWVVKTEEKGSDVNLASYLLIDAFRGDYEAAVVISNDSDLLEPIRFVQKEFGFPITVLNPHENTSQALKAAVSSYQHIWRSSLKACQFPPVMQDAKGTFHKPSTW